MFRNLPEKFKKMAKMLLVLGILEMIAGIIVFIVGVFDDEMLIAVGIGVFIVGLSTAFLLSLFYYAFGDVLDYLRTIAESNTSIASKQQKSIGKNADKTSDDIPEI